MSSASCGQARTHSPQMTQLNQLMVHDAPFLSTTIESVGQTRWQIEHSTHFCGSTSTCPRIAA